MGKHCGSFVSFPGAKTACSFARTVMTMVGLGGLLTTALKGDDSWRLWLARPQLSPTPDGFSHHSLEDGAIAII